MPYSTFMKLCFSDCTGGKKTQSLFRLFIYPSFIHKVEKSKLSTASLGTESVTATHIYIKEWLMIGI